MKLAISLAAAAATAFALPAPTLGASPDLRLPHFSHLRDKASETVDVSVGGFLLRIAKRFAREEADREPALRLLQDIDSVEVRSFKFDRENAYTQADVDAVRSQLRGPEWSAVAQIHKRDPKEDVDVYLCVDEGKTRGLTVIAAQERELTFVNIVGNVDVDSLAELEGEFGIPKVSEKE